MNHVIWNDKVWILDDKPSTQDIDPMAFYWDEKSEMVVVTSSSNPDTVKRKIKNGMPYLLYVVPDKKSSIKIGDIHFTEADTGLEPSIKNLIRMEEFA